MANKIPWFELMDWKSIVGAVFVTVIVAALIVFKFLPDISRSEKIKNYNGQTSGLITNVIENTIMKQNHDGNTLIIESFTISYSYKIDGQTYEGINTIRGTDNNSYFIKNHFNQTSIDSVIIKYDFENRSKSLIQLKE